MGIRSRLRVSLANAALYEITQNYEPIEVHPGDGFFNNRCQLNAIQASYNTGAEAFLCVIVGRNRQDIYIHFINRYLGHYYDNTLGFLSKNYDYYIIRKIREDEYYNTDNILIYNKVKLFNQSAGLLHKIFLDHSEF